MISSKKQKLKEILKEEQILSDPEGLKKYNSDWLGLYESQSEMALFPESHQNVQDIVKWACHFNVPLVPCGGRTGLSGGAIAQNPKEVMLSFERMNHILEFNQTEQSLRVEPGVITQQVQDFAQEKKLYFPLSFASEGSSQIGGNVATNAGGIHVIRYGSLLKWVAGLKLVTGEGKSLSLGKSLIKNTAGYNLLPLFVGSEGTLGLITEITLYLTQARKPLSLFLLTTQEIEKLIKIYTLFKQELLLNAFEMFTANALDYTKPAHFPLKEKGAYFALIEFEQKEREKALSLFESALEKDYVTDGVVSESPAQAKALWAFRENISEALAPYSPYKNDISVRPSCLPPFLCEMEKVLKKEYPDFPIVYFGHIGDGNLHINILNQTKGGQSLHGGQAGLKKSLFIQKCEAVNKLLFSLVQKYGGSISAEHGVGILKKTYLSYSCSEEEIMYMKALKKVFDPKGILNPGKIFDLPS